MIHKRAASILSTTTRNALNSWKLKGSLAAGILSKEVSELCWLSLWEFKVVNIPKVTGEDTVINGKLCIYEDRAGIKPGASHWVGKCRPSAAPQSPLYLLSKHGRTTRSNRQRR